MFTTRPDICGTFGVVATTHWLATAVGMSVLERGGNAFDAACAAAFTLQVAEPHLNGPGGDAPIIVHAAGTGAHDHPVTPTQHVLCGQGPAPAAATLAAFADLDLDLVPGTGFLPATIPGAFGAWCHLLRDHGTWELPDILAYAIGYAKNGVPLVPRISATIETMRPLFEAEWHTSAAVFLPHGKTPRPGALFRNPALAATYERICTESTGPSRETRIEAAYRAWYQGFVAEAVGAFFAAEPVLDASGRRHRGLLTAQDFATWQPTVEAPVTYDYHGHTVLKCGPWSQGPAFLQQLALLKGFDIGAMDPLGPDFVHTVTECAKLAFADREAFYGDVPDVPLTTLLSDGYNGERRALVGEQASRELRPGNLPGRNHWTDYAAATARADDMMQDAGAGEPTVGRLGGNGQSNVSRLGVSSADTVHIDVIDRWGNMVSATPSGGWLQSSPVIPELGFPMGTRGQMFWLRDGVPNGLAPGKRPRTTLSPSMALRDGKPWMAFGTPGGEQQDQWSLTFFLRMVHHRWSIQQAIDAPCFHSEHWPSSFWPRVARPAKLVLEGRYPTTVLDALLAKGHVASRGEDWSEGRLSATTTTDGLLHAGANPRGMQGYAAGR